MFEYESTDHKPAKYDPTAIIMNPSYPVMANAQVYNYSNEGLAGLNYSNEPREYEPHQKPAGKVFIDPTLL